jgi:hypothetical protein
VKTPQVTNKPKEGAWTDPYLVCAAVVVFQRRKREEKEEKEEKRKKKEKKKRKVNPRSPFLLLPFFLPSFFSFFSFLFFSFLPLVFDNSPNIYHFRCKIIVIFNKLFEIVIFNKLFEIELNFWLKIILIKLKNHSIKIIKIIIIIR